MYFTSTVDIHIRSFCFKVVLLFSILLYWRVTTAVTSSPSQSITHSVVLMTSIGLRDLRSISFVVQLHLDVCMFSTVHLEKFFINYIHNLSISPPKLMFYNKSQIHIRIKSHNVKTIFLFKIVGACTSNMGATHMLFRGQSNS